MEKQSVDLIIPVYRPDKKFDLLLQRIKKQTIRPDRIILIQTLGEGDSKEKLAQRAADLQGLTICTVTREEYDHGGTRNYGASLSEAEYILFMTQDAVPKDNHLIEALLEGFSGKDTGVVYARQLASEEAGIIERYTREFNYPPADMVKSREDLERLGIKTYFCSNVCAMYKREIYLQLGGFVTKTIFNEDSIMASQIIGAGKKIVYASKARVIHSHKYTYRQQFSRNFDLGVSHRQYREIFRDVPPGTEGVLLVKKTLGYLIKEKKIWLILDLVLQSGFKFLGYKAGCQYEKLPRGLIKKLSMNKAFWKM